ncbi:MAG TPA: acetoacetate decarboxylase family protein [Aquabacterium sp.]|nr:acetoacetate decarboxylase family protein [Aquabacterium sp.]
MSTLAFVSTDPFFNVPRTVASTSQGPVQLPILYHRTRNLNAFFMVPRERVQAALDQAGASDLQPGCVWGDQALVALACYEYLETSIGAYNEIGLAVPVVRAGVKPGLRHWRETLADVDDPRRELGFFVLHLPVNTEAACAAGRDIWGLPKFVTPIDYGRTGADVHIVLHDPAGVASSDPAILTLQGHLGLSLPAFSLSPVLYSQQQGRWLRTTVNVRGGGRVHRGQGLSLTVGPDRHPMAQTLHQLGLNGARPWLVMDTDRFQSRLNGGQPWR